MFGDRTELATGGRYDALAMHFRNAIVSLDKQFTGQNQNDGKNCKQHVVGGAINMKNLVTKMGK